MSETVNIGEVAEKLSVDIFKHFFWSMHPKWNEKFQCSNPNHKDSDGAQKSVHPGDVLFSYEDPYLGITTYLHTDLKSYDKKSITKTKMRDALKSLSIAIECARDSDSWRKLYSIDSSEDYEVKGLLFIHNHDHRYQGAFYDVMEKVGLESIPIPPNVYLHYLGPQDIQRLYSIANDIIRLMHAKEISSDYTFYYPDLVMRRRQGDVWSQPATVEALTSPYLIVQHKGTESAAAGYIVYYNRPGSSSSEFEYFLDSLSRYQMLESGKSLQVRVTCAAPDKEIQSNFRLAKERYAKAWGFEPVRQIILDEIKFTHITAVTNAYNPGWMGWRE
ncbi:hypothetical protein [Bowmanella yangjiangensis]|uniref:GAPS4 PD-(D/E)XK nuclease domain-containing protein n=1 Tax=Bowmanella yangjiangensis TaxID=2811230 RepID=A0ABS3CZG4_9ALTE|nr:hypothetical protein [Bowmanella yangjiangensis]MBN7822500.1 hypothetical protein [Bowmanella yangjiangensis]